MLRKILSLLLPFMAMAAMADVPQVTSFYPDSRNSVQEYRTGSSVYAYFNTGAQIVSAEASLVQNGQTLGTLTFAGSKMGYNYRNTATMKPADNPAISLIQAGQFTIEVTSVTYVEDGETLTAAYEAPYPSTTYRFMGENGKIVAQTGLPGNTLRSYYHEHETEGIKTFTFSKPINPEADTYAFLEYGFGDAIFATSVPCNLSDDGLTLSIDFRCRDLSSATLAYGHQFTDENGNRIDPPTAVVLDVKNLICTDGSRIMFEASSLDGQYHTTLQGEIFLNLKYEDISLPTPVLKKAEFYPSDNPDDTHPGIMAGCDMMALTVLNGNVLSRTDITLQTPSATATVEWGSITVDGDVFRCALPSEIIAAGSDALVISLTDYAFISDDGVPHVILPLSLEGQLREVTSVADVKALQLGEKVYLNVPGGVVVTLSNDFGYCFLEDEADGLMILTPDYTKVLQHSVRLTGRLAGSYQGNGTFMIDPAQSAYDEAPCNTSCGHILGSLDDIDAGLYDNRLVSFVAGRNLAIEADGEYIYINKVLPVVTDFVSDFSREEVISDLTGIVYFDPGLNQRCLILRQASDVNQEIVDPTGIASQSAARRSSALYNLQGQRLGAPAPGICIMNGRKIVIK